MIGAVKTPARLLFLFLALAMAGDLALRAEPAAASPTEVKVTPADGRIRVEIGGRLFTEYIYAGADRPYCYPILAPDGTPLTRDFPMKDTPGEDRDHKHHRSLWFAHSDVNGIDFWNEGTAGNSRAKGRIVHDAILETKSGDVGMIRASDRWVAPTGQVFCTDETTVSFQGLPDARIIDYAVTLRAPADAPVFIGDDKDGTIAVRLAQWMTMPHKNGKQDVPGNGHIVTATGDRDEKAWGKRSDWCDYHAPHNGQTYGVAIFDNPQNLRHPTWWMARDYGLFGANPFGQHFFEAKMDQPHLGDYTIPAGGSLTLRYRFYFHYGDEQEGRVAERYAEYAKVQ